MIAKLSFCAIVVVTAACAPPSSSHDWTYSPFMKTDSANPVLTPGNNSFHDPILGQVVLWDEKDVFNPAAVVRHDSVYLLFRAEDKIGKYAGTSRIGLAVSADGLHFTKRPEPVLFPDQDSLKVYEWEGGIEDPRIAETEDGRYLLTYTAYDGKIARLCFAFSNDLIHWNKHGLVVGGEYRDTWSKSGAVVVRREGNRLLATRVSGYYWMYFGDTDLFLARSADLIHWTPLTENGKLQSVLRPRPKYFDSRLVESGPCALLTTKGIVLIYNGMNLDQGGDPEVAPGAYCAGQALFDSKDPTRLIDRTEHYFMRPDKPYEIAGQVNQVCFLEGLVPFKDQWFLYYGTADSRIAAATSPLPKATDE